MKNPKSNWTLDIVILLGFLVSFFLNLTGLAVHQWLGIAVFLGIMMHLVNHWDWVKSVFSRFFRKTSSRARIYALIDGLLLYGFVMIIETGLVISTWFNLNLTNYEVWLDIHIYSSITTLILAVLKIGLHWRWIVKTAIKIFTPEPRLASQVLTTVPQVSAVSRRDFLVTMGLVGLGSALAISNVLPALKKVEASTEVAQSSESASTSAVTQVQPTTASTEAQAATAVSTESATAIPTTQPTTMPTSLPTTVPTAQNSLVCYATCPKGNHCAFPGRCGRYQDQNSNGLCDLGECS